MEAINFGGCLLSNFLGKMYFSKYVWANHYHTKLALAMTANDSCRLTEQILEESSPLLDLWMTQSSQSKEVQKDG